MMDSDILHSNSVTDNGNEVGRNLEKAKDEVPIITEFVDNDICTERISDECGNIKQIEINSTEVDTSVEATLDSGTEQKALVTNEDIKKSVAEMVPEQKSTLNTDVPKKTKIEIESNILLTPGRGETSTEEVRQDISEKSNYEVTGGEKDVQTLVSKSLLTVKATTAVLVSTEKSSLGLITEYESDEESQTGSDLSKSSDIYSVDEAVDSNQKISDTDSDTDSVVEVPVSSKAYRQKVYEINSNTESSSESSSDTEDEEDENKGQYLRKIRKAIDKSCLATKDDDDDDQEVDEEKSDGKKRVKQPPKVKGEMLLDDLPPIEDLHISVPEAECVELGKVHSIVEQLLLVSVMPNSLLLDLDTVLFLDKGQRVLGTVFDVLGQVADPLYCVRFNNAQQIIERNINVGDVVYVAPKTEHTQFIILSKLMGMRGSDASWENDVEPPPRYLDYSDDEQERTARAKLRGKDRSCERTESDDEESLKRPRIRRQYDADDDSDVESVRSTTDSLPSTTSSVSSSRSRGGYRRGGGYKHQRGYYHPHPHSSPRGFGHPQYNTGSWHSNYYPNYRVAGPPPPQRFYGPPPHIQPPRLPLPLPGPHGYQQSYGPPPPMFSRPPPQFSFPYLPSPSPSGYSYNPCTVVRPTILSPGVNAPSSVSMPPPPPPGEQ